jgi:hypothetical protein
MEPPRYHTMLIEEILLQMDWQTEYRDSQAHRAAFDMAYSR